MSEIVFNTKIRKIEPVFDKTQLGGSFLVYFDDFGDFPLILRFSYFLGKELKHDENLYNYVKNNFGEQTVSAVIQDLYEVGYPFEEKIQATIDRMFSDHQHRKMLETLFGLFDQFGGESSGSLHIDIQ